MNKPTEIYFPEWHKNLVRKRISEYRENPDEVLDFDTVIDQIEDELSFEDSPNL